MIARALAVLKTHRLTVHEEDAPECSCGDWYPDTFGRELDEFDQHLAEQLEGAFAAELIAA